MDVKYERCCGIDVHKKTVVACVIVSGARKGEVEKETRTYATMADDLEALAKWLQAKGVTHVALESTGDLVAYFPLCSMPLFLAYG
jgi:hypothetical protein